MRPRTYSELKQTYSSLRAHGASLLQAARKLGITEDRAQRLEGRTYCDRCGVYVSSEECVHWDYES